MNNTMNRNQVTEKVIWAVISAVNETQTIPADSMDTLHDQIEFRVRRIINKGSDLQFIYKLVWLAMEVAAVPVFDVNRTQANKNKWEDAGLAAAGIA